MFYVTYSLGIDFIVL